MVFGESIFVSKKVLKLLCEGNQFLFKLRVSAGSLLMFVEVVFELGDLVFKFDVLIIESIGLIWEFDHSGGITFPTLIEFFLQGKYVVVEELNLFRMRFDAYCTTNARGTHNLDLINKLIW